MTDPAQLTHVDAAGAARMVDVSAKQVSGRLAVAAGRLRTTTEVIGLLRRDGLPKGDALAVGIFDVQAKAMGLFVAMLAMALDPEYVVIGGGLMDPDATTDAFRARYLQVLRDTAAPFLWSAQKQRLTVVQASLGDLSQAIGAALVALYSRRQATAG